MQDFIFPSVASEIVDNSFTFVSSQSFTDCLQVITADKGEDRVLKYFSSQSDYVSEFGDPNLRKHGQVNLNLFEWLKSGGGAWILRVTADDAAFSHAIFEMGIKKDTDTTPGETHVLVKPVKTVSATALLEKAGVTDLMKTHNGQDDAEGFKRFPLFSFAAKGRSAEYNNLGLRLEINSDMDGTFDFRVYNLSVVEKLVNGSETTVKGPFLVALEPSALGVSRESLFIENVFNKYASEFGTLEFFEDGYEDMGEFLGVDPADVDITSPSLYDIHGAEDIYADLTSIAWATKDTTNDLEFIEYRFVQYLEKGVSGDLSMAKDLKIKGYSGLVDPGVTDKVFYPIHVLLDGNEDKDVKTAMAKLSRDVRKDCVAILDMGFTANPDQCIALRNAEMSYNSYFVSLFAQDQVIYDEFSSGDRKVTSTYFLASKIPANDIQNGRHFNFVGPRRGSLGSFKSIGWVPNDAQKQNLYKRQINYIERSPKRTNFATQLTSQVATSHMSNLSVVRMMLDIQRDAEAAADDYRMEYFNPETLNQLQTNMNNTLQRYVTNGGAESLTVSVVADDYDKSQKRCRVLITCKPTSIMERIQISINVVR